MSTVLAFDLGASGGKAYVGLIEKGKLKIEEIHRFENIPVKIGERLHWDILRIFHEIKQGLLNAKQTGYSILESIGVDSWGVDFGLIGSNGELINNPYHYRDEQVNGMIEKVVSVINKKEIYERTGIQFIPINTINQLYAMNLANHPSLNENVKLLMIPDLIRYFLTGEMIGEETNASTTQLFNQQYNNWDPYLIEAFGLPINIFPKVLSAGANGGVLRASICNELNIHQTPVNLVGEHDTASAVAAVPTIEEDFAYLSCGTWSLLGTETDKPVINEKTLNWNFTNEKGVYGTNRLLKNIMGLWLIQQCRTIWNNEGKDYSFDDLVRLASNAEPFYAFINPDDPMFLNPAHMPKQVQEYCQITNQKIPESVGQIVRCILESLAFKYRDTLEKVEELTGKTYSGLHIVGGGIKNQLLCQFTASAIGKPVWTGPADASAVGNIISQLITVGEIESLKQARQLVKSSFEQNEFEPINSSLWNEAYKMYKNLMNNQVLERKGI